MNSANPLEPSLYSFQEQPALILEQVDDAIALLDADQRLVLFNQKLVQTLNLDSAWLKQQPCLSEILALLVEQGNWSSQQRDHILQACDRSSGQSQAIQINQSNQLYLELYTTATSNGGKLLIFRNLTAQRQAQNDLAAEVRRLTFLLGLTERLQTSDNLTQIGRFALSYLVEAMGAAFGDVKVVSGRGPRRTAGMLTNLISGQFIATYGEPAVDAMQQRLDQGIPYGQGLLWQVVETGQPCFVEDYANHPQAVEEFRHPAIGQLGIFPIPSADGTIIGVLTLESRSLQKLQEAPQQDMLLAACRTLGAAIERAQAQARLQRINQDLERASRLKSEFLASMSHELRTPLNSILGFSELLLRQRQGLDKRQVGHISLIRQSGQHLLHLINDILDLSKVEAGKVELDLAKVSIQELCRQCLEMIQPRAERKRLSLSLELDYQLDQVVIDERRVRQIVINLLSNAVKFTPEKGKVKLAVQLAYGNQLLQDMRPDESPVNLSTPYLCIAVSDTGIGITEEKKHLLFQPFQQIDASLTRRHEGTGLGLALTKRLAELHGGTVSFESKLGEGSTFRVWLPLNELRSSLRPTSPQPPTAKDLPASYQTAIAESLSQSDQSRVLVVEDQPYNQSLIAELLEIEGYTVDIIADGQTMLETIRSPLISVRSLPLAVLMDIQLPNVDGFELIRQLKAHQLWQSVPVIAVTAMAMTGDRDRCLAAGADAYLSKPLDFSQLVQQLNRLIEPPENPT
ncbi:PAS domain-containing hybrid sensor histidine kinase/response regulator [Almyronema epifaneia]|uniref:histidine kinase n=1 Tax=Almyronema epifaneia S1 TaxID=2991925 RepID=A0ABW6IFP1_9CYAN